MDVARWLLSSAALGPLLIGALALAWFLAVRLRRVSARTSELAASERQYRRLIEESPEGIVIHRLGVIRFTNAAALRLFGFTDSDQAVGKSWLDLIAPGHREAVTVRVDPECGGSRSRRRSSWKPSGGTGAISGSRPPQRWSNGKAAHPTSSPSSTSVIGSAARPRSGRPRASAVTKLANAAAHEINNPLTVVGGNLQLLAERLRDRPELDRYFERGERAIRQIADMISHMTRITRLTPLSGVDTGGVPTLDLRRSSEPSADQGEVKSDTRSDTP